MSVKYNKSDLQLSPYLFLAKYNDEETIATNLSTGEILLLTKEEENMLINCMPDSNGIFEEAGFLVRDKNLVRQLVIERHRTAQHIPSVFNLTILPTLSCNFRCSYCFENEKRNIRMRNDTSKKIIEFVKRQSPRHQRLNLAWFGGEPLLEKETIANLTPQIRSIAKLSDCEFVSSITTNGYLLDTDTINMLKDNNIRFIQITLDGDKKVHDRIRITKNKKGTFDNIFNNLLTCLELFPEGMVTLRVNATYETVSSILNVLKLVPNRFRRQLSLHMHHIMNIDCPTSFSEKFSEMLKYIYQSARKMGFEIAVDDYLDPCQAVYCYAERDSNAVIDPSGNVYRCAYSNFSNKERVGILNQNGIIDPVGDFDIKWNYLVSLEPNKCSECNYLPICGFGCPRLRVSALGSTNCKNRYKFLSDTLRAKVEHIIGHIQ